MHSSDLPTNSQATVLDALQVLIDAVTRGIQLPAISINAVRSVEITPEGFTVSYGSPSERPTTISVAQWADIPLVAPAPDPSSDPSPAPTTTETE